MRDEKLLYRGGDHSPSPVELIFSQRTFLMGLAMVSIMLFHERFVESDCLLAFHACGHYGVDVFFFLSGMGIACSLRKNPLRTFYANRFWRIFPAWLLAVLISYAVDCGGEFHILDFLWWAGHWWFLRTLAIYYLVSPLLVAWLQRSGMRGVLAVLAVVLAYFIVRGICQFSIPPIELSHSVSSTLGRLPAYIMGLYVVVGCKGMAEACMRQALPAALVLLLLGITRMWMVSGWELPARASYWTIQYIEPALYPFVGMACPGVCYALACIGRKVVPAWLAWGIGLFGAASLELYLWHEWVYGKLYPLVPPQGADVWLWLLLALAASLILSWVMHGLCSKLIDPLRRRLFA